jgi:hypothetical protein
MRVRLALSALLAILPSAAFAGGPVCRDGAVVDEMAREIRAQDYYTRITNDLVTETPTGRPNVVRCQVCVLAAPYDTLRFGDRPVRRCEAHAFEVRILEAGFVVRDLP